MPDKKPAARDPLPEDFATLEEMWSFWDTHSSADYEDDMESIEVEIDLFSSKVYCPVAKDLLSQVRTQARMQASRWKPWSTCGYKSGFVLQRKDTQRQPYCQ